jgi:hypothetical protein
MGLATILQRLLLAVFALSILISMPLFKAYGYGTNKNKVRVAPLSYFLHGLEQIDAVKKSKRMRRMADDLGTWLHVPGLLAEDYGITQFFEENLNYKSIWKSKHVKTSTKSSSKKKKKKREKEEEERKAKERNKPIMLRAKAWRNDLNDVKDMAKGDMVGVAAGGLLILTSLIAPLVPAASQFVLLCLIGMNVGVSRQNLPGQSIMETFYYAAGLLAVVIVLDYFVPDLAAIKRQEEHEAKLRAAKKAKKKKKKERAKEAAAKND